MFWEERIDGRNKNRKGLGEKCTDSLSIKILRLHFYIRERNKEPLEFYSQFTEFYCIFRYTLNRGLMENYKFKIMYESVEVGTVY